MAKTISQAVDEMVAPGTIGGDLRSLGARVLGAQPAAAGAETPPLPVADPAAATPGPVAEQATQPAAVAAPPQHPFVPPPQVVQQSETRTQVQGGIKADPALVAQAQESRATQANALASQTMIEADAAQRVAKIEQEKAEAIAEENRKQEEAAAARKQAADDQLQRIRDAQAALPDRPPEATVGQKIARGIALSLGVVGRALGGSIDVHRVIEDDKATKMAAWRAQYDRMRGRVGDEQNIYAALRQQGLDDTQAALATVQRLNTTYSSLIGAAMAESKAPLTIEQGRAKLEALKQENIAIDQKLHADAQARWTQVKDERSKVGGVDVEGKSKLIKLANDDSYIKRYRESSAALSKFQDLVKAGADGAALADFIAGSGGLDQGSFGPNFVALLKKRNIFGQGVEKLRETFQGGVDPTLLRELENGLAAELATATARAAPSIQQFRRDFASAGIDPALVTGGETSADAAAEAGAAPSAYQGRR